MPNSKQELESLNFTQKRDQLEPLIKGAFRKGKTYKTEEVREALEMRYNEVELPQMPKIKLDTILEGFGYKVETSHSGNDNTIKILNIPQ